MSRTLNLGDKRYDPCRILARAGIPSAIWLEDATRHHGVPTIVHDLYLLVSDLDAAANTLERSGWNLDRSSAYIGNHAVFSPQRRLALTPSYLPVTLLLSSAWHYDLKAQESLFTVPPLHAYIDSLLFTLLDGTTDLRMPTSLHLAYLYEYVRTVKDAGFTAQLQPDNRQAHLDIIAGADITIPFISYQRSVRDELRAGTRGLKPCSSPRHPSLFPWLHYGERAAKGATPAFLQNVNDADVSTAVSGSTVSKPAIPS